MITEKDRQDLNRGLKDIFAALRNPRADLWQWSPMAERSLSEEEQRGFTEGAGETLARIAKLVIHGQEDFAIELVRAERGVLKLTGTERHGEDRYEAGYLEGFAFVFSTLASYMGE